jgi:hypothetical protein
LIAGFDFENSIHNATAATINTRTKYADNLNGEKTRLTFPHFAENLNTVVCWNFSPGFRIVLGKSGWFGESG